MNLPIEILEWIGAACVLAAYVLISTGRVTGQSVLFHSLNVAGSAGFIVNLWWHRAIPSMVLNIIWCAVGLYALFGILRRQKG